MKTALHLQCSHFESQIIAGHSHPPTRGLAAAVPVMQLVLTIHERRFQVHKSAHCNAKIILSPSAD